MKKSNTIQYKGFQNFETISPATKLLEKRRQMYEINEAFDKQKDEFKENLIQEKEEDLREQDLNIQAELINFCKFLQDNEAKKNRAEKRLQDELKQKEQKEKEIKELQIQQTNLQKQLQELEQKVQSLKKYEDYLESVMKAHGDKYPDMNEITGRYKKLNSSNQAFLDDNKKLEELQEQTKHEAMQFYKEKNQEILQYNNDIKDLAKKLEEKNNEKMQLLSVVEESNKKSCAKNLNLARTLMAIDNIYNRCVEGMVKIKQNYEDTQRQVNEKGQINKEKKILKKK
ncbi:hypothetical protein IMG5_098340 [Ichthyophthirius multifiliis]|uniref:DUF4200 domain-containing protein n=1 Tax=Ichthyophthirius multifiliis TaxID=5932 RepID=G0QRX8_ICHMU|nr:hypothetical protein IMG5_098340 [Ichthyophthirius multifiliis]EGR32008.1 hypothetical protein IMG5_098340 [Ichthyophthirius multifiliis]|eukprot:XP_004035494.1 hypothetical protein IMG5_098340 [Ichthyophthirius multifiliis]